MMRDSASTWMTVEPTLRVPCSCRSPRCRAPGRASRSGRAEGVSWGRRSRQYCGTGISTEDHPESDSLAEDAVPALDPALADSAVFRILTYFPEQQPQVHGMASRWFRCASARRSLQKSWLAKWANLGALWFPSKLDASKFRSGENCTRFSPARNSTFCIRAQVRQPQ